MDTTSKWFDYLHNTRGLSEAVIKEAQLSEDLGRLRIPIFDEAGNKLYAKLRRPFDSEVGPKYIYETGAKATLYGVSFTDLTGSNYYVEGEMDALAMRTLGYNGYSSTGGAMTFKEEWLGLVDPGRPSVILFDNDEAGQKGAIKLAQILKTGWFCWVPPLYGKDVSDLLMKVGIDNARHILAEKMLPFTLDLTNHKSSQETVKTLYQQAKPLDNSVGKQFLLNLAFTVKMDNKPPTPKKHHPNFDNGVASAKAYPIENLINFRQRKAKCLWHVETSPSLHYYKETNHVHCFGCGKTADSIDVYMQIHNCSFQEAIKNLLS